MPDIQHFGDLPRSGASENRSRGGHPTTTVLPHLAVLLTKDPPVTVTTLVSPQATIAPPSSCASLSLNVPPSIVTLAPPRPLLPPELYT